MERGQRAALQCRGCQEELKLLTHCGVGSAAPEPLGHVLEVFSDGMMVCGQMLPIRLDAEVYLKFFISLVSTYTEHNTADGFVSHARAFGRDGQRC